MEMMDKQTEKKRTIIAVYCRYPETKQVKTRLAQSIGTSAARRFYAGCLESLRDDLHYLKQNFDIAICPSDENDKEWAGRYFEKHDHIVPQIFGNLGLRLEHTDLTLRCLGYDKVIIIGSDAPSLPLGYIENVNEHLSRVDVALGPCLDGGVYAIGSRVTLLPIQEIPWGTRAVFSRLRDRLGEKGFSVGTPPTWYDVDRVDDLVRVHEDLVSSSMKHRRALGDLIERIFTSSNIKGSQDISISILEKQVNLYNRNGGEK